MTPSSVVDRIADDPARAGVLDRKELQRALTGVVFSDVSQPDPVQDLADAELPLHQIIMDRGLGRVPLPWASSHLESVMGLGSHW